MTDYSHGRDPVGSAWRIRALPSVGIAAALATVLACGSPSAESASPRRSASSPDSGAGPAGKLLVSAASSLTEAFGEVAVAFQAAYPEVGIQLNLGGSSSLAAQILEGAPVDVFASADPASMTRITEAGGARESPRIFAENRLAIAVPPGNPGGVSQLEDFAREELLLGLCAREVPCGGFAGQALARAGVAPAVDTREPNARALLTKVELEELDAAILYATDVGGGVEGIRIPDSLNVVARYPIAVLAASSNPTAARTFVDFVLSTEGQAILRRHGFSGP